MDSPTTVDARTGPRDASRARGSAPVVIEARGISKSFRIPDQQVDSLKERVAHPFTRVQYRQLRALDDVSFDVHQGEFFGIVGRNGSGKSTLLKVMASIYGSDAGRVRIAGRLAPFIELGVGFNPELTARENVVMNGVLMGLTKREAAHRLDAVVEFAGLEDFVELKLKNYSSGMIVRLAFAVMVQADADIMLIDEVLAVGDAAFAQKCMEVFQQRRDAGRTVVLVTHDMTTVQSLCDRAMLLHDGKLEYVGDSEEAAMRYYRLNFATQDVTVGDVQRSAVPDFNARIVHAHLSTRDGRRIENLEENAPLVLDIEIEARRELASPTFVLHLLSGEGTVVFGFTRELAGGHTTVAAGERIRIAGEVANSLVPGRYLVDCWVRREGESGDLAVQGLRVLEFVVYGTGPGHGLVSVESDVQATLVPGEGAP